MAEAAESGEVKQRPIVPFLHLGEKPHLKGLKCRNCGATYIKSGRIACSKCGTAHEFDDVALSTRGNLWVFSIVHQSAPGIPTPYVSAIVDLPEGVSVRCNLIDIPADPEQIEFGIPVEMITKKVRTDKEGNDVIAFFFRPVD